MTAPDPRDGDPLDVTPKWGPPSSVDAERLTAAIRTHRWFARSHWWTWHRCMERCAVVIAMDYNGTWSLIPPDSSPLSRFREQPRQPRGCSILGWLAAIVVSLAFWAGLYLVVAAVAAPSSGSQPAEAPVRPSQQVAPVTAGTLSGAPYQVGGEAAWQVERGTRPVPEEQQYGAPQPAAVVVPTSVVGQPAGTSASMPAFISELPSAPYQSGAASAVSYTGKLGYALPSHGSRYLAIRWPRGTVATLCGPADCVTRVSTDFGPVRSLWEAGRLADLSAVDWQRVCGVDLRYGLCQGTLLIVSRPRALPETSTDGSARDGG
jgi:hypothetical protein